MGLNYCFYKRLNPCYDYIWIEKCEHKRCLTWLCLRTARRRGVVCSSTPSWQTPERVSLWARADCIKTPTEAPAESEPGEQTPWSETTGRRGGREKRPGEERKWCVVSITASAGNETVVAAINNRNKAKGLIHHSFELKQQLCSF